MSHMVTVADTWEVVRLDHIGPSLYVSVSHDPDEVWSRDVWMQRMTSTHDVVITYTMEMHGGAHVGDVIHWLYIMLLFFHR